MTNIQDEVQKIHHQYGMSEVANYKIQLLCEKYAKEYHDSEVKKLNIPFASGSVDLTETNNTNSIATLGNTTTDTTMMKAGWYSDNFSTYYLDEDGVKHYR